MSELKHILLCFILLMGLSVKAQVCNRSIFSDLEKATGLSCSRITPLVLAQIETLRVGDCSAAPTRYLVLDEKEFVGLSNLKTLNLCEHISIEAKAFEPLSNLESLVITLRLRPYPDDVLDKKTFRGLTKLKNLDLETGWFPNLSELFEPLQDSLTKLRLRVAHFHAQGSGTDDSGHFKKLKNLKSLVYRDSCVDRDGCSMFNVKPVPRFLAGLENLESLWLDSILTFAPDLFEDTKQMKVINARSLKGGTENFDSMKKLETLNVEFSREIQWRREGKFKNLTNLKTLQISDGTRGDVPFGKEDLPPNFQNFMTFVKFRGEVYFKNQLP